MAVLVTWMSFASGGRELRGGALSMLETHIVMSSLIFCLVLIPMFHLTFTLVLRLALLFACFVAMLVTWMSFASGRRELRGGVLSMLETHIVMSSLIFRFVLIPMFRLVFTLVLRLTLFHLPCLTLLSVFHLSSLMDPTITHMVLVHERTTFSLDTLVTAHVLIVVIVSRVGLVLLLEGPFSTLSRDPWTVHAFPVVVHVPLGQVVRCKGL
jgi:hypothetical protein